MTHPFTLTHWCPLVRRTARWHHQRRVRLRAVVRLRESTMQQWAANHGVSHTHLNLVLRGKRESAKLDVAIADAIEWAFGLATANLFRGR